MQDLSHKAAHRATAPSWALPFPHTNEMRKIVSLTLVIKNQGAPCKNTFLVPKASAAGAAQRYPSALPLAWPRALTHGLARSHAQRRAARARAAPAPQRPRHSIALGTPAPSTALGADAREPTQWPHAGDRYRATHRALPARLPSYADYILRLQDTEPESLEIMLRLLLVALPLVVALPAAFDAQGINALQLEVQSPLQLEVRSPPKSRPLRPQPAREINTIVQPQHTPLRTHTTRQAHTSQWTRRGALECEQDDPPHDLLRHQPLHRPGIPTHHPQVCPPARPAATHAAQLRSALPLRARGRCACCRRTLTRPRARERICTRACPTPRPPRRACFSAMQLALAIGNVRARRLACFSDGLRVAPPMQAAAAACGRA